MPDTPFRETPVGREIEEIRAWAREQAASRRQPKQKQRIEQPWDEAQLETLRKLRQRGRSIRKIAVEMKRPPGSISSALSRYGTGSQEKRG